MKILICGDSFAADWQVKYPNSIGWPNLLAKDHQVTNLAQAGCSEYRVLRQLMSVDLSHYDCIIIAHSSPFRIYVKDHPVHKHDSLHANCDLIYSDIKDHATSNMKLLPIVDYFENYFDPEYAIDIHNLICRQIDELTRSYKTLHITGFEWDNLYSFENMLNFNHIFRNFKGIINHYTLEGNMEVYDAIRSRIGLEDIIREFYSDLKFPGDYHIEDLKYYDELIVNPFLRFYDNALRDVKTVLDIGCGSGFIVNFLARKHPTIEFDAVDFSDSIELAKEFSTKHGITNISYHKENFLNWKTDRKYDLIICNGVLHHIPEYSKALEKIKILADKKIAIGIYNTYGKLIKKFFRIRYRSSILFDDQERCPFELTFTDSEFRKLFSGFVLNDTYPGFNTHLVDFTNLVNYSNGGLTLYLFSPIKTV